MHVYVYIQIHNIYTHLHTYWCTGRILLKGFHEKLKPWPFWRFRFGGKLFIVYPLICFSFFIMNLYSNFNI